MLRLRAAGSLSAVEALIAIPRPHHHRPAAVARRSIHLTLKGLAGWVHVRSGAGRRRRLCYIRLFGGQIGDRSGRMGLFLGG